MPQAIRPFVVASVHYRCRDIGYGTEEDTFEGYWVNYVDTWGKFSWTVIDGAHDALYLFPDELVTVEYLDQLVPPSVR